MLVDNGCWDMMVWDEDCSSWDDSVDIACLEKHDFNDVSEEDFVIMTWHDDESLEEVSFFAKIDVFYMILPIEYLLFLHISTDKGHQGFLSKYQRAIQN